MKLANHLCENEASISSKLKTCCAKTVWQKIQCLNEVEHDMPPPRVRAIAAALVENNEVCKNYTEAKDDFLGT